jgi:hypothetical protein
MGGWAAPCRIVRSAAKAAAVGMTSFWGIPSLGEFVNPEVVQNTVAFEPALAAHFSQFGCKASQTYRATQVAASTGIVLAGKVAAHFAS